MNASFYFVFSLLILQNARAFVYREWNSQFESRILKNLQTDTNDTTVLVNGQAIRFNRQIVNKTPVYGSFIKKIAAEPNTAEIVQTYTVDPKTPTDEILTESTKSFDHAASLKKLTSQFEKVDEIKTENVYVYENKKLTPYTVISFFERTGTPYEAFFNSEGNLVHTRRAGSQFADVNATVYTDGPKLSQLSEQLLKQIAVSPVLNSAKIIVGNESDKKINSVNEQFKYDIKDDRFDQVQVFYYLTKSFQWMSEHLKIDFPNRIEAVVNMGFPEKTNSAFYFQNKIRFGKGDDVYYANIAQDASIVYHESFHAMIDGVSRLPFEGQGGSLNEAFADFFTCLMLDRPYLGEASFLKGPFKRNLNNASKLEEKNGGLYHDSLIISGLLWETKEKLGAEKAKTLALQTLLRLNAASDFTSFNKKSLEVAAAQLNAQDLSQFRQILKARGFIYE